MPTLRLLIEYDGTHFAGWQTQPGKRTVQETIEKVLSRITQEKIHLAGASRTDAGVHALGQVAHFKTSSPLSRSRVLAALSGLLPNDIAVKSVQEVPFSFHAQKDAVRKTYRYLVWNARIRSALLHRRVWHVWAPLNVAAMRRAARYLAGRHDFSAFRGAKSDTKTSVRRIYKLAISRQRSANLIKIEITGNGFLKYMVRNIVGTLVEVGRGRLAPGDLAGILKSGDRRKAGMTAPACGLYLVRVVY